MRVVRIEYVNVAAQHRVGQIVDPAETGAARDEHEFKTVMSVQTDRACFLHRPDREGQIGRTIVVQMIQFH